MEKKCFKCSLVKPIDQFYKHPKMADGYLGKCKECTRSDTVSNRAANIEYYRAYDRERGNRQGYGYVAKYRKRFPNKCRAHRMVRSAVQQGKLSPCPCEQCGAPNTHAHHDDYAKPLNVRWLCPAHHKQWHDQHGEALNP